jgi:hypothetical protein
MIDHAFSCIVDAAIELAGIEDMNFAFAMKSFLNSVFPLVVTIASNGINQTLFVCCGRFSLLSTSYLVPDAIDIARPFGPIAQTTDLVKLGACKVTVEVYGVC